LEHLEVGRLVVPGTPGLTDDTNYREDVRVVPSNTVA